MGNRIEDVRLGDWGVGIEGVGLGDWGVGD